MIEIAKLGPGALYLLWVRVEMFGCLDLLDAISPRLLMGLQILPGFGMFDPFEMVLLWVPERSGILHHGMPRQAIAAPGFCPDRSIFLKPPSGGACGPLESGPE